MVFALVKGMIGKKQQQQQQQRQRPKFYPSCVTDSQTNLHLNTAWRMSPLRQRKKSKHPCTQHLPYSGSRCILFVISSTPYMQQEFQKPEWMLFKFIILIISLYKIIEHHNDRDLRLYSKPILHRHRSDVLSQ